MEKEEDFNQINEISQGLLNTSSFYVNENQKKSNGLVNSSSKILLISDRENNIRTKTIISADSEEKDIYDEEVMKNITDNFRKNEKFRVIFKLILFIYYRKFLILLTLWTLTIILIQKNLKHLLTNYK